MPADTLQSILRDLGGDLAAHPRPSPARVRSWMKVLGYAARGAENDAEITALLEKNLAQANRNRAASDELIGLLRETARLANDAEGLWRDAALQVRKGQEGPPRPGLIEKLIDYAGENRRLREEVGELRKRVEGQA